MQRLRTPDWLLGVSGVVLLASLWLPWYEVSDGTVSGWNALKIIDVWLALTGLLAIATLIITAERDEPSLPVAFDVLTTWAGFVAALLVVYRVLSAPGGLDRGYGLAVAAIGAAGVLAAAFWAMRKQEQPGLRPPPEVRAMPVPPAHDASA